MRRSLTLLRLAAGSTILAVTHSFAKAAGSAPDNTGLLSRYVQISQALANEDLKAAKATATELAKQARADGVAGIQSSAKAVAGASDLA